jgi:hypothetical protein
MIRLSNWWEEMVNIGQKVGRQFLALASRAAMPMGRAGGRIGQKSLKRDAHERITATRPCSENILKQGPPLNNE